MGLGGEDGSEWKLKVGLEGIKVMEKSRILPQHGFLHFLGQYSLFPRPLPLPFP